MRAHSYEEFFAEPITPGRFWWTEEGVSMLLQWGHRTGNHVLLFMRSQPSNWSESGERNGWDGDLDHPTLCPSLQIIAPDGSTAWHGFLRNGMIEMLPV